MSYTTVVSGQYFQKIFVKLKISMAQPKKNYYDSFPLMHVAEYLGCQVPCDLYLKVKEENHVPSVDCKKIYTSNLRGDATIIRRPFKFTDV